MILCDREIRAALIRKALIIEPPPSREQIATSAVDLHLGDEFRRWKGRMGGSEIQVDPASTEFNYSELALAHSEPAPRESDSTVLLKPGEFLLNVTRERVALPKEGRLAARVEGRSTLARLGMGVHVTAPTIHNDFRGKITLEITNHGSFVIKLRPGLVVCQLIVETVDGTPEFEMVGIFQDQTSVIGKGKP